MQIEQLEILAIGNAVAGAPNAIIAQSSYTMPQA